VINDYILLDDNLQIMVVPHLAGDPKWFTYDELDEMRRSLDPRITRIILADNKPGAWPMRLELIKLWLRVTNANEEVSGNRRITGISRN
jgi:hypothetical protein